MTRIVAGRARRPAASPPRPAPAPAPPPTGSARRCSARVQAEVDLVGARFADLYAGSGAVGLEALSRGAAHVLLVESDPRAARVIRENIAALRAAPGRPAGHRQGGRRARRRPGRRPVRRGLRRPAVRRARRGDHRAAGRAGRRRLAGRGRRWWWSSGPAAAGPVDWVEGITAGAQPPLRRDHPLVRSPIMRRAVCPGSFDPVTNGHLDIIGRASRLFDEVIVAVLVNQSKQRPVHRRGADRHAPRGDRLVRQRAGRVVPRACWSTSAGPSRRACVVKGLRAVSDFDYELQMAQMNIGLAGVETLFMPTNPLYSFLSSSLVKDVAKWGGDVSPHVPERGPRSRLRRPADAAGAGLTRPARRAAGRSGWPHWRVRARHRWGTHDGAPAGDRIMEVGRRTTGVRYRWTRSTASTRSSPSWRRPAPSRCRATTAWSTAAR